MSTAVKWNEKMASDFITGTCQLIPKLYTSPSHHMDELVIPQDNIRKQYRVVCGSQAEIYIRPLNSCIADTDYMMCNTGDLAFSGDFPVLPSDISVLADTIECYKIDSYNAFPGFVGLRHFSKMMYSWKIKEYKHHRYINPGRLCYNDRTHNLHSYVDECNRIVGKSTLQAVNSGPAIKSPFDSVSGTETDLVYSIYCPQWPRDAQTWPLRPRNNRWPTSDTISEVVRNGCHVVYSQHRACRDDIYQHRLSFSVAEVILLQSWTKTQQIVYHLLRFFAKRELIKKDCSKEDEVLCTYHLKTLMLWTCEQMPPEWWDSSPVIAICCELLKILSDWLQRRKCPNYFIPEANLFHQPSTSTQLHQIERRVNVFQNYDILNRWFVENYILPITRTKFQFLCAGKATQNFMNYMLPLIAFRKVSMSLVVEFVVIQKFSESNMICRYAVKILPRSGMHLRWKSQQTQGNFYLETYKDIPILPTTANVLCFKYYDIMLYSLQFAYILANEDISWVGGLLVELVSAISRQPKIIRSQFHNFPKSLRAQSSRLEFMRAQDLMEDLTGLNSCSEFQLVYLMSKEFFRKTLEADGYESNGVTAAAFAYLAALYFASSEYQQAMRLSYAVLSDQTPQEEKETLNACCLLFIDDIARIVGLSVLHKTIIDINLHCIGRHLYLDLRLSPEVFVQYLIVLSCERCSTHFDFGGDLPDSSFPMDNYMKVLIKPTFINKMKSGNQRNDVRQIVYRRRDSLTETETTSTITSIASNTVIDLLMGIALENMISFYSVILTDFGMKCNIVDCYRALYSYKCLNYKEVLQLCERILNEPDLQSDLKEFTLANVSIIPPLDSFFDSDVQSLLGFHTLFYYLSPPNDDLCNADVGVTEFETRAQWFANGVKSGSIGFNGCILRRYCWPYQYFLGRHFLARYLKVRCCIDCNLPCKESMTEFAAEKINFPFELIIRRFLLQRHRIIRQHCIAKMYLHF